MSIPGVTTYFKTREPQSISEETSLVSRVKEAALAPFKAAHNWIRPVNPVTKQREVHLVPTFVEKNLGSSMYPSLIEESGGEITVDHPKFGHYARLVKSVGQELSKKCPREGLDFEFVLVDSQVKNAWCLPGGKIAINLGLVQAMEEEKNLFGLKREFSLKEKIAAVLGHEITHAGARHGGRSLEFRLGIFGLIKLIQYLLTSWMDDDKDSPKKKDKKEGEEYLTSILFNGLTLCCSRSYEFEADKFGMHLMKSANYDPEAAVWLMNFFDTISDGLHEGIFEWFATHPSSQSRVQRNQETLIQLQGQPVDFVV